MKKILLFFVAIMAMILVAEAQAPEKFSYQSVIRDAAGNLVANEPVGVRVSILQYSPDGSAVYSETHNRATNANGLVTMEIGAGTVVSGSFSNIDWASGPYFLKIETDVNGGTNYTLAGTQQMLSVPYALYAAASGNGEGVSQTDFQALVGRVDSLAQIIANMNGGSGSEGGDDNPDNNDTTITAQACPGVPTVTDIDGNVYNTVQIGEQCWMRENLKTTKYANGTTIPLGTTTSYDVAYRYYPNGNSANVADYGYLYNWPAVMNGSLSSSANPSGVQGICPNGWHVPSDAEWTELTYYVSRQSQYVCGNNTAYIGKALASEEGWNSSTDYCAVGNNPIANNATGFSARPASDYTGYYLNFGNYAHFWGATQSNGSNGNYAYYRYLYYDYTGVFRGNSSKRSGYSVRCVRN